MSAPPVFPGSAIKLAVMQLPPQQSRSSQSLYSKSLQYLQRHKPDLRKPTDSWPPQSSPDLHYSPVN